MITKYHFLLLIITISTTNPAFADSHGNFPGKGSAERYNEASIIGNKAIQCAKNKDYLTAVKLDKQAIQIYPFDSLGYYNLGIHLKKAGLLKEAHKAYEQAIAIEPDYQKAWQNLGGCNEKQRNLPEAEKCYRKAASLNPTSYDAVLCIGDILRQQGKFADAKKFFLKAKSMPDAANNPGEVDKLLKLNDSGKKEVAN